MSKQISEAEDQAARIRAAGKRLDYEQEAIDAIIRSWVLSDPVCQRLALADAQVWATLHLARNGLDVEPMSDT